MKPRFNHNYNGMRCRVYLVRENSDSPVIIIKGSADVHNLVKEDLVHSDREVMLSIMLTCGGHLIGVETVYIGLTNQIMASPREIFKSAILANACSIVLCHNHPSGDLTPSLEDLHMTEGIKKAGDILNIRLLDHIIVSSNGYFSLRDNNQLK